MRLHLVRRKQITLATLVVAILLSCSTLAQADPPSDGGRQPRLMTWQFEFAAEPISVRIGMGANPRPADLGRLRGTIRSYLHFLDLELLHWERDPRYDPQLTRFIEYLSRGEDEPPAWYRRLRIFQMPQGGFLGFSPTDLNQRPDGSYFIQPNRTVP